MWICGVRPLRLGDGMGASFLLVLIVLFQVGIGRQSITREKSLDGGTEHDIQVLSRSLNQSSGIDQDLADRKFALAYQDYFRRHLTNTSKSDVAANDGNGRHSIRKTGGRVGIDKAASGVVVPTRSRMPYGLSKGLLDIRKANEHYLKVHMEARCRDPKPRVVRVKEFYPDPSKEYLPSCTLLHHCSDQSGCCDSDTSQMQCVAKRQVVVELNFYKLHLSSGGIGINGADTVERLSFVNDTECECQVVDDRPRFHVRKTMCLQCPSGFTLREQPPGTCACDCFDKQKSCLRLKRGREMLPETDRRCVEARRCHQPDCEYGIYDGTIGRCPKKTERRSGHHAGHHWWKFDERD